MGPPLFLVFVFVLWGVLCAHTEAKVPVQCRMPDVNAAVAPGTTRQFVEYCPEEAWGRGVGNTLIYYPVIFWFAVFTGRDVSITDLSSVGSVCRVLNCGFPFTSEVKKQFPHLKLENSPRKINYHLVQYFSGNKTLRNDIININGYASHLLPGFLGSVSNSSACTKKLAPHCAHNDYSCLENFAFRQHFPGGFRNESMLPESTVGLSVEDKQALVHPRTSATKTFHAGIHIRAQLSSLEKRNNSATLTTADFNLYNNSIFPLFNDFLTKRFYSENIVSNSSTGAGSYDVLSPPRVFVSVDDITLKQLLVTHLQSYRHPLQPVHVTYVNNSQPITHAKHMKRGVTDDEAERKKWFSPADREMVPTMFDWYGLSQAEFVLAYR